MNTETEIKKVYVVLEITLKNSANDFDELCAELNEIDFTVKNHLVKNVHVLNYKTTEPE